LLEVMSFELPVESVETVAGMKSWKQKILNLDKLISILNRNIAPSKHCV